MSSPEATLVLPQHLHREHPLLVPARTVLVWDDPLLFADAEFNPPWHAATLAWRRAAVDAWAQQARSDGFDVQQLRWTADVDQLDALRQALVVHDAVHVLDPVDDWGLRRLEKVAAAAGTKLHVHDGPGFLLGRADAVRSMEHGRPRMATFYQAQRRRHDVLLDAAGEPVGGRWSFDADNRQRLPRELIPVLPHWPWPDPVPDATRWSRECFPGAPGDARIAFAVTPQAAERWLADFIEERLDRFGPYEDAIHPGASLIYHAAITPMLNHGLLTPQQVLDGVLGAARERPDLPLQSIEGFVRQLIGWREYMRAAYEVHGRHLRTSNRWGHERGLPRGMWDATTGIAPIDDVVGRVLSLGWCHHIERLMVLGNYLFLVETHPNEVHRWFMAMFTDALDWVMVPNVHGMSQDAAGGLLTTKPYFSGSAYLRRMGWPKGDWCELWDALYWRFIIRRSDELRGNARWAMAVKTADRFDPGRRAAYVRLAEQHIESVQGG